MIGTYVILVLLSPILCQFDGMDGDLQPDVTFGEQNDRFDLNAVANAEMEQEAVDFRKSVRSDHSNEQDGLNRMERPKRRFDDAYAYDDKMEELPNDGGLREYESNLAAYRNTEKTRRKLEDFVSYLHNGKDGRRSGQNPVDPEKEILLHYAVPINMKIHGYLQAPVEN